MSAADAAHDWDDSYAGPPPPWDIDRPQPAFVRLAEAGALHGVLLDAGCGTGRVARELAGRGVDVVGVDAAESMIATARRLAPELAWHVADIRDLTLDRRFDVVVMAGNVPLFTPPGTQAALVAGCARHLRADGALVCGFQLGSGYQLADYDDHCREAGLALVERWSTWHRDPFPGDGGYVVSVHRADGRDRGWPLDVRVL